MHACNHMTRSGPCAHGVATCGHGSGTHSGRRDSAHRVYARGSAMARRRGPRASPVPGCLSPRNPICVFRRLDLAPLVLDTRRGGLSQITQTERDRDRERHVHTRTKTTNLQSCWLKSSAAPLCTVYSHSAFAVVCSHGTQRTGLRGSVPGRLQHTWPSERWCPLRWPQQ